MEYSNNCSKTFGSLWQYYKDEANDSLTDSESLKCKIKTTGNTLADSNTKDVEVNVPLKYLSNFWETLQMPFSSCEISLILTWSSTCVITNSAGAGKVSVTDTNDSAVTLTSQGNAKFLQHLISGFKRMVNWNKY